MLLINGAVYSTLHIVLFLVLLRWPVLLNPQCMGYRNPGSSCLHSLTRVRIQALYLVMMGGSVSEGGACCLTTRRLLVQYPAPPSQVAMCMNGRCHLVEISIIKHLHLHFAFRGPIKLLLMSLSFFKF